MAKISVMDVRLPPTTGLIGSGPHGRRTWRTSPPIEDAGGPQFEEYFGDAIEPILLSPAMDGRQRASEPGFLLVAAIDQQSPPWASSTSWSSTATPTSSSSPSCPSTSAGGSGPR